jgi:hypothetical protein
MQLITSSHFTSLWAFVFVSIPEIQENVCVTFEKEKRPWALGTKSILKNYKNTEKDTVRERRQTKQRKKLRYISLVSMTN